LNGLASHGLVFHQAFYSQNISATSILYIMKNPTLSRRKLLGLLGVATAIPAIKTISQGQRTPTTGSAFSPVNPAKRADIRLARSAIPPKMIWALPAHMKANRSKAKPV